MPELPEVECLTRAVRSVVLGRRLLAASFHRADLRWPIPVEDFTQRLVGQTILDVRRRSKYLILATKRGYGIFHLGMSGNILLSDSEVSTWKHTHARFTIASDASRQYLHFVDPRRFGCILSCGVDELDSHPLMRDLGPEPLECEQLLEHLVQKAHGKQAPIKSFLMDAHNVVGVGNIYANEALFMAGIRPGRRTATIKLREWESLVPAVQSVLRAAIEAGGTSFRDYKHVDGEAGYFKVSLQVYGRQKEACLRCGGRIQLSKIAGRASYFCRSCQS